VTTSARRKIAELKSDPISEYVQTALRRLAWENDVEICGFIRVKEDAAGPHMIVHPMENVSHHPKKFFDMDDAELIEYYSNHIDQTVGVYHSHPSGSNVPSHYDCVHAPKGMRYFVVTADALYEWDLTGDTPRSVE
jgi:proteasome lid subunit RPN8/RPN11